jgi:hypothetical protein
MTLHNVTKENDTQHNATQHDDIYHGTTCITHRLITIRITVAKSAILYNQLILGIAIHP